MRYSNVRIETIAALLPDEILSSAALESQLEPLYSRLNLPAGRLELMTGIRERRLWPRTMRPSEASAAVGRKALEQAGVAPEQIDCLLHCAVSRDFVEPATSSAIHNRLALPSHAINFDISNACLGVLSGMITVANMIELGQIERGLVVAAENSRPLLETTIRQLNHDTTLSRQDIKSWFASLTIGSAAAAVVLAHRTVATADHRLLGGVHRCNTEHNDLCQGSQDGAMDGHAQPVMQTDSEELLKQGVAVANDTWQTTKDELAWANDSPEVICTHQVGRIHRQRLYEALDLDMSRDFATVETLGNCGAASLPATVACALDETRVTGGDTLALLGIGSGINCLMLGIEW